MLWVAVAYFFIPLGLLSCLLLLSGVSRLESWGSALSMSGVTFGRVRLQLDKFCVLVASVLFAIESMKAGKIEDSEIYAGPLMEDRGRMRRWRHERNYWISLYMLTLWSVAWRVAYLIGLSVRKSQNNVEKVDLQPEIAKSVKPVNKKKD